MAVQWQRGMGQEAVSSVDTAETAPEATRGSRPVSPDRGTLLATRTFARQVRGQTVAMRQGLAGVVLARELQVRYGAGLVMAGLKVGVQGGIGQWLVGGLVQAKHVLAIAVIAGRVDGQVRCLFDTRGAFAFGLGAAIGTGLLRLLVRRK
jgi:hypothetical protein